MNLFDWQVSDFSHVIVLESTEEEMTSRAKEELKGEEGEEELLKTRLEVYQENTKKMVDDWEDERVIKVCSFILSY
jgi:hypothetical protein